MISMNTPKMESRPYEFLLQRQSVFLHTWHHQGPCKPSSCATFKLNSHWGRAATGKKRLAGKHAGSLRLVYNSLQPCGLWPARLLCQGGVSPAKNTGAYWPILVAIPF